MKRNFLTTVAAFALVLALAGCAKSADEKVKADEKPSAAAEPGVKLEAETQTRLGLATTNLPAAEWTPEIKGFGRVVDAASLAAAVGEFAAARSALEVSTKELARVKTLTGQGNASDRALQTADAAMNHDQLAFVAARAKLEMNWGKRLAENPADMLQRLEDGQSALVRIDLAAGEQLPSPGAARIAPLNQAATVVTAEFFDATAGVDPQTQSQSFLFVAKSGALTPGAAVTGLLKTSGASISGVVVPASAVLRHEGKGWIYVQTETNRFARTEIPLDRLTDGGWFVSENVWATNRIVINGAQTLLSAELGGGGFNTGNRD